MITNQELEPIKKRMSELVNKDILEREVSFAMQAINASSGLQNCSKESLQKAVYNIALTGLSLNPVLKYAYLIPRWSRDGSVAVLEPSYQGLIKLLTDTGSIVAIYAHVVNEGDEFDVVYGTSVEIIHRPKFKTTNVTHVYAVAILEGSNFKQVEVMTIDEINAIKARSESFKAYESKKVKSCIWVEHFSEMAKKTVIKRIFKYLPKTDKFVNVATAISLADEDYPISDSQSDYLVQLIEGSSYDHDTQKVLITRVYEGITKSEFEKMKNDAQMNTMDPISAGLNYNQTDISTHLKKIPQ